MKKKLLFTLLSCLLLLSLGLLTACDGNSTPADTTAEDTPAPTEPDGEVTKTPTEGTTDGATEEETTEEVTTEPETDDGIPLDSLTIGGVDIKEYTLVVQDGGAACVRNSADELIEYLEKATGGFRIPEEASDREIVIGVTDRDTDKVTAARNEVKLDGYTLLMDGNRLYITGSCDRGTMYGVYCFLEDYIGVRFFAKDTTVVINQDSVEIPADVHTTHNPVFEMRDTYWYDMRYDQTTANHAKDNSFYDSSTPVADIGGGIGYAGRFVHTINLLQDLPYQGNVQPCLTDESVYQLVLSNVRKWLDANPEATIISVSQNDSDPGKLGCQCENCKAIDDTEGTPMGSLLTFINRIANDIKDDYPGVYVDTLAYRYTRKAPKNLKPADNVIIRLCSIECCFTHALSDESCAQNKEFKKDIEEWAAICDNLYIWDYTYNAETYFSFFPNFDVLWDNVNFYKDHNVTGVFLEGQQVSVSGEFAELRSYLLAKLLWDPDMTEEEYYAHMDEFLMYYYGAGWEKIKDYMTRMTAHAIKNNTHIGIFDKGEKMYPAVDEDGKRDIQFSRDMLALWEEAYELAVTDEQKAHVEKSSIQAYYLCHLSGPSAQRKKYLQTVYELCEKYGIEYYKYVIPMPDQINSSNLDSLI
ncbi:MAG: DUF4838 domain-containing protein [Clostridia bacterium]|nr:DUF4838 domain-containing protein [Clostridia bacterium]